MKVSLSVSMYITVWVEKGHYLAKKSVMQIRGLPNLMKAVKCGLMQSVLCRGSTRPVPTFVHGEGALLADGLRHAVP